MNRISKLEIDKEIEIRGRIVSAACDIEYCLLNIIVFCHPDPHNHERLGQFKEMKMGGKIDVVKKDLKEYKIEYYKEFEQELNGLDEFRKVRNEICHCKGDFPNSPNLDPFRLTIIELNNGKEQLMFKDYSLKYIEDCLKMFFHLNHRLGELWLRLKDEYDLKSGQSHPFLGLPTHT